jgi:hypothetical protein
MQAVYSLNVRLADSLGPAQRRFRLADLTLSYVPVGDPGPEAVVGCGI